MNKKLQVVLFIMACGMMITYGIYQSNKLVADRIVTSGIVKDVHYLAKSSGYFVSYEFWVDGKQFKAKSSIPYAKFNDIIFLNKLLPGRSLPVLYQSNNPGNSVMLFTTKDYKIYKQVPLSKDLAIISQVDSMIEAAR